MTPNQLDSTLNYIVDGMCEIIVSFEESNYDEEFDGISQLAKFAYEVLETQGINSYPKMHRDVEYMMYLALLETGLLEH